MAKSFLPVCRGSGCAVPATGVCSVFAEVQFQLYRRSHRPHPGRRGCRRHRCANFDRTRYHKLHHSRSSRSVCRPCRRVQKSALHALVLTGELGGRLQTQTIGTPRNEWVVERGANWVQGTQTDGGPVNPIWTLVQKHGVKTQSNDWYGSVCECDRCSLYQE